RSQVQEELAIPSAASPQGGGNFVDLTDEASLQTRTTAGSSGTLSAPVYTAAVTTVSKPVTASKATAGVNPDLAGLSHPEGSESSEDSFYEIPEMDSNAAKRWYVPSFLRRKTKILSLKSKLAEKEAEAAEVIRLRDQVSSLSGEKSSLAAEVSYLKVTVSQKDHDISLLDSRATSLASELEDAKAACTEAGNKMVSLASKRDRLLSEVSSFRVGFQDFKAKMEAQQEERWLLTHGLKLALLKCLKSSEYQGVLSHALGQAIDFGMQEGLAAGQEHGVAGRGLSVVDAYDSEGAKARYINAVKSLEDAYFPLVDLLRSKKDAGMDEVLDCFLLDGPLADLPETAQLQLCLEQLTILIHHTGDKTVVGETSLSFALMNVHSRATGARKHAAALRKLMIDIVSEPLSSQTWLAKLETDTQETDKNKAKNDKTEYGMEKIEKKDK
ncbi:hypothetical protein Tco_1464521, partial [Tanacetum coccineum]